MLPAPHHGEIVLSRLLQATSLGAIRGDRVLFSELDLAVDTGEIVRLVGPNGCGKTTLLKILAGLREADSGEVLRVSEQTSRYEWHEQVQFVGHRPGLSPELTARENLHHWSVIRSDSASDGVTDALTEAGLEQQADLPVAALSAGQRQRVALAKLALCRVTLWLLDEPFTALDKDGRQWVEQLLVAHAAVGGAVIMTTHQSFTSPVASVRTVSLAGFSDLTDATVSDLDDGAHPYD